MAEPTGHNWQSTLAMPEFKEEIVDIINYTKTTIDSGRGEWFDETPYNDLTVGMNHAGEWGFQTGDNSYTGGAYLYPFWSVVSVTEDSDPEDVFKEIVDQFEDQMCQ